MTTPARRDQALDAFLRRSATGRATTAPTSACLDAETVAAWVDGGLSADAQASAEAHAADCGRCQAMLASVLATSDSASPAGGVLVPVWRRSLPWTAPLAAAAVVVFAVVIWTSGPRSAGMADRPAASPEVPATVKAAPEPAVPDAGRAGEPPAPARKAETLAPRELRQDRFDDARTATPSGSAAAPAAGASAQASDAAEANVAKAEANDLSARDEATAPPAAAPSPQTDALRRAPQALASRGATAVTEIASPDPATRWRIRSGATVERSADGGQTWVPQVIGAATTLTAGSAPSASVCWIVGRGGMVFVTSDGTSWTSRPLTPAVDLVGVTATNALVATVIAADGRRFATIDGGNSWTAVSAR